MKRANAIGMLAVGLGIAAAMAVTPGVAAADSTAVDPAAFDLSAFDPSALFSDTSSIPGLNLAISVDGYSLFQSGEAYAYSGTNDFAISYGESAVAQAGDTQNPGSFDFAFADGNNADAISGLGDGNSATAFGSDTYAAAGTGSGDTAFADGTDTTAIAGGNYEPGTVNTLLTAGNDNFAAAIGNNDVAEAVAYLDGSSATSTGDIATIFGNGSDAFAGVGDHDFAGVLGEMLTAMATGASNMFDFVPSF